MGTRAVKHTICEGKLIIYLLRRDALYADKYLQEILINKALLRQYHQCPSISCLTGSERREVRYMEGLMRPFS